MTTLRTFLLILVLLDITTVFGAEPISGRFALTDHHGNAVTEESFDGRFRLVFFGFTRCPIICPTTMVEVTRVLNQLGPLADQVQPLFITIDPVNDTVEVVASYAGHFHSSVVGLTGTREQIEAAAKAFNVTFGQNDEEIYHSSYLYLMDKDGSFLDVFGYGDKAETILSTLNKHLTSPAESIRISDAWISKPTGAMSTTIAGFLCLENAGATPVQVTGASSKNVERVEIHEISQDNGIARMKKLDAIDVPSNSRVCLEPDDRHLMLIGIDDAVRAGANVRLQIELATGAEITVSLPPKSLAKTD